MQVKWVDQQAKHLKGFTWRIKRLCFVKQGEWELGMFQVAELQPNPWCLILVAALYGSRFSWWIKGRRIGIWMIENAKLSQGLCMKETENHWVGQGSVIVSLIELNNVLRSKKTFMDES